MNKKYSGREIIVCLVILIITGFGYLTMHMNSVDVVDKSEAGEKIASFESFDYSYARGGYIHYIVLEFSDAENLTIDSSCASWELIDMLREIPEGTQLYMLIDESQNLIFELKTEETVLLSFDDSVDNISSDKTGMAVLGAITIAGGLFLLVYIFRKKQKNSKTESDR